MENLKGVDNVDNLDLINGRKGKPKAKKAKYIENAIDEKNKILKHENAAEITLQIASKNAEIYGIDMKPDAENNIPITSLFELILCQAATIDILRNFAMKVQNERTAWREKAKDLEVYISELKPDADYAKWKQAQKQGRQPKSVNWERYDLLNSAQLTQKQIAQLLGVSPNTLRKLVKARK